MMFRIIVNPQSVDTFIGSFHHALVVFCSSFARISSLYAKKNHLEFFEWHITFNFLFSKAPTFKMCHAWNLTDIKHWLLLAWISMAQEHVLVFLIIDVRELVPRALLNVVFILQFSFQCLRVSTI